MVAHACNPCEAEAEGLCELEASLNYRVRVSLKSKQNSKTAPWPCMPTAGEVGVVPRQEPARSPAARDTPLNHQVSL